MKKNKGVFESPTPLSVTFKDARKFDIQNPILFISTIYKHKLMQIK